MRKVLPMSRIREMEPYMDAKVLDYIHEGQIEAFEGFEDFDLIAFDWYDVRSERTAASQMLLYLDREDLFVFCEDDAAADAAQAALLVPEEEALSNEQVLHRFFVRLLRGFFLGHITDPPCHSVRSKLPRADPGTWGGQC